MTKAPPPHIILGPMIAKPFILALQRCRERMMGDIDLFLILGLVAQGGATADGLGKSLDMAPALVSAKAAQLLEQGLLLPDSPTLQISPLGTALLAEIAGMLAQPEPGAA